MGCLFKVNGKNRFKNNQNMTVSVYGVRTALTSDYEAEFLVFYNGSWIWNNAKCYTPIENKHI